MKKIAFAIIFAMCVSAAFAEFSIGGGADMIVVPLQIVSKDTVEDEGNIWFGSGIAGGGQGWGIRTRLVISGTHEEKYGFRTDIDFMYLSYVKMKTDPNDPTAPLAPINVYLGDFGNIWWKPAEWLRIDVGRFGNGSQAGKIHDHWLAPWTIGMFNGNYIFSAQGTDVGFRAEYTPPQLKGLSVSVLVPEFGSWFTWAKNYRTWPYENLLTLGADKLNDVNEPNNNDNRALRVFERTWLTVGYENPESFHARIQYIGANPYGALVSDDAREAVTDAEHYKYRVYISAPRVETAFAFLGVKGLVLDFGVKAWLPVSDWLTDTYDNDIDTNKYIKLDNTGTYWGGIGFGFGVSYNGLLGGNLGLNFRADGDMLRNWKGTYIGKDSHVNEPMTLSFHLWPTYKIEGLGTIVVNAGLNYIGRNEVVIDGKDRNKDSQEWEYSDRLRFGAGLFLSLPIFDNDSGFGRIRFGFAYRHGTSEAYGGEPRAITFPVSFFYTWR